ncbi:hypothetical protein QOZ80_5AG0365310 [Eleusine coracana subsp. coracana]|nr:hypothetical protein QOZ80_5AG0365310 [Eleusine coracana subsp. coracana]
MASSSSSSPSSPLPSLQARQDHPGAAMVAPQGSPQTPLTTDHEDNQTKAVRCRLIRQTSDILRSPHIDVKELRICVGTWNVGGICPPTDLDIQEWLDTEEPADIYVLGFQEIIPLEVGYMIGSEDNRPVAVWEHIIGETLNKKCPDKSRFKYYSAPPSPSNSNPSDYAHVMDDEFLTGEKDGDELKRNAHAEAIHKRTMFNPVSTVSMPQRIHDHERIIWLGDLNYRINLSYELTLELISKQDWDGLFEKDQLKKELGKGCTFDGWVEGLISFPPTYKYEFNSQKYVSDETKSGRRTPSWCDRILSHGKGIKLLSYKRSELTFSDHRPVTAVYMVETEVLRHRKLLRALVLF